MTDRKSPVGQAVDLVVFAPIGLALEARRLLPAFVERGRSQVQMAKFVGRFAVQQGEHETRRRLARSQTQFEALLTEFGLRPGSEPSVDEDVAPVPTEPTPVTSAAPRSSAAAAGLAIADYDSLAASQVIPRLLGLEGDELEAVRSYEAAHRGRKTILGRIAQLQAP